MHTSDLLFCWCAVWLKNRTATRALPYGETPYEMLYNKKPNLKGLYEWGKQVWVHTSKGTKLDGWSKVGKWIGYDETSDGHRIYWPDKRSVTIERSIKFSNGEEIFAPIPAAKPIQGEKGPTNLQRDPEAKSDTSSSEPKNQEEHTSNYQQNLDNPIIVEADTPQQQKQNRSASSNQVADESVAIRSQRTRIPTRYVRDIQSGVGTADNRPGKSNLPIGIQIPKLITQLEGETEDDGQIKHAMATAVSEMEAIDPQSLEEATRRPDWPKWEIAIQEELNALKRAGTWGIVERPKERSVVKNKWVFRIKKNSAGNAEWYKARLVAKGFTQVFGVDYYDTWAPVAKFGLIRFLLATATQHVLRFFLFCFVYLCLFIIFRSESWCCRLTHFSLTHIAATLLTHSTAVVLTHSIAILIALPHWCSIYSGQSCRLFFS